jgi:hypothetical protein
MTFDEMFELVLSHVKGLSLNKQKNLGIERQLNKDISNVQSPRCKDFYRYTSGGLENMSILKAEIKSHNSTTSICKAHILLKIHLVSEAII